MAARLTVFGLRTGARVLQHFLTSYADETAADIDRFLTILYGERVLSDKEKKKLAKLDKFKAKQESNKQLEVLFPSTRHGPSYSQCKPKKEKEKPTKAKAVVESTFVPTVPGEKKGLL